MAGSSPRLLGKPAPAGPGRYRFADGAVQPGPPARHRWRPAGNPRTAPALEASRPGRGSRVKTDLAVVGGGLAALTAARAIQRSDREVVLVWPGLSSLYFLYATIDVLGYADAGAAAPVDDPGAAVAGLIKDQPSHPYARAGRPALEGGTKMLLEWLREAGLVWEGTLARNVLLPTATGTPKPSCLVPASMAAGDLRRADPIGLCGFH